MHAKMSVLLQKLWIKKWRAEKYSCDFSSRTCMLSQNEECCYFIGVTMEEFPDDREDAEHYKWAKVDRKVKKAVKSVDIEATELFNEQVKILKAHIFVERTLNIHYKRLK